MNEVKLNLRVKSAIIYVIIFSAVFAIAACLPFTLSIFLILLLVLMARELVKMLDLGESVLLSLIGQGMALIIPLFFLEGWKSANIALPIFRKSEAVVIPENATKTLLLFLVWQLVAFIIIFVQSLLLKGETSLRASSSRFMAGLYLAFPLFSANAILYTIPNGWSWLVLAFVTPWISDSLSWWIGSKFGQSKLFPKLSPNKTVAGFYAGLLGTGLVYLVLSLIIVPLNRLPFYYSFFFLGFGLLASLIGQIGDLLESALKRRNGIKDSGDLIPGHGGILDRFDSTLLILPVFYLLLAIVCS